MRLTRTRTFTFVVLAALLALVAPAGPATADGELAAPTIELAADQPALTNASEVRFTLTFPVVPDDFGDLAVMGSAGSSGIELAPTGETSFEVSVTPLDDGTMTLVLPDEGWSAGGVPGPGAESPEVTVDRVGPEFVDLALSWTIFLKEGETSSTVNHTVNATDPSGVASAWCDPPGGSTFSIGLHLVVCSATDNAGNESTGQTFVLIVLHGHRYTNFTGPVVLGDEASPYPSRRSYDTPNRVIEDVDVNVVLTHGHVADLDLVLIGPRGQSVMLMSDVGCGQDVTNLSLRFDQDAPPLPASGPIAPGAYAPTDLDQDCGNSADAIPGLDPGSWSSSLDVFSGTLAQGGWNLYAHSDTLGASGVIEGWSVMMRTSTAARPTLEPISDNSFAIGGALMIPIVAGGNPAPTITFSGDLPEGVTLSPEAISGTPPSRGTSR